MTGQRVQVTHGDKPSKVSLVLSPPYYFTSHLDCPDPVLSSLSLNPMAASRSYVLLQKGEDPFHTRFEDLDGLTAFTV
jgi:hypothetical protein